LLFYSNSPLLAEKNRFQLSSSYKNCEPSASPSVVINFNILQHLLEQPDSIFLIIPVILVAIWADLRRADCRLDKYFGAPQTVANLQALKLPAQHYVTRQRIDGGARKLQIVKIHNFLSRQ